MSYRQTIQRKDAKAQSRKEAQSRVDYALSLAPGFSPVSMGRTSHSCFNGLADLGHARFMEKTVETLFVFHSHSDTRLKPRVKENCLFCVSAPLRLCVKN
jgi:hypothetical protein